MRSAGPVKFADFCYENFTSFTREELPKDKFTVFYVCQDFKSALDKFLSCCAV